MSSSKKYLQNAYDYFHILNIVFYILIALPLLGFCYAYLQYEAQGGLLPTQQFSALHLALILGTGLVLGLAFWWYRRGMQQVEADWSLQRKLEFFYHRIREKYFLFMIANSLAALGLYLTGEQLFAAVYTVALVAFSLHRPTLQRVIKDLRLSKPEQNHLVSNRPYDLPTEVEEEEAFEEVEEEDDEEDERYE